MKNFLAVFKCAENSKAHQAWMKMSPEMQKERMESGAKAQEAWTKKYGDQIIYDGGPLDEKTKFVDNSGIQDRPSSMGAFLVIKAASHAEVAEMFLQHPHFANFPGDGVEVVECRSRHDIILLGPN